MSLHVWNLWNDYGNVDKYLNRHLLWLLGPSLPTPDALREELKKATRQKDKRALENIIDVCETTGYPELGPELCRARNALQQIGGGRGG